MNNRIEVRKTHKLFIAGKFPRSESGHTFSWEAPDGAATANICRASRKDFRDAVTAARSAHQGWSNRTAYNRGQIIYRCAEMLEGRSAQFREELRIQGSNSSAAQKEVTRAIDLLIYYAGHGYLDKEADEGFWLPVDAEENSQLKWIPNTDIIRSVSTMNAKHVMVVADSCFSGTLTRGIKIREKTPDYLQRISKQKARVAITSGGEEPCLLYTSPSPRD